MDRTMVCPACMGRARIPERVPILRSLLSKLNGKKHPLVWYPCRVCEGTGTINYSIRRR